MNTTYYPDQVHLTNTGYGIFANYVTAAIKQIMNPITVSNVSVTPSTTTATVTWTTNQTGSTKVNYGLTSSYGSSTTESDITTRVLNHSASLSSLTTCTTYHFQTVSNDLNGNQTSSTDQSFTTTGCVVSTQQTFLSSASTPVCSDTTPIGLTPWLYSATTKNGNQIEIKFTNWQTPTDHFVLEYGTTSNNYQFAAGNIGGKEINSYTVNYLNPNTTYYFRIRAGNGCAVGSWSNEISAKTLGSVSTNNLNIVSSDLKPVGNQTTEQTETNGYDVKIKVVDTNQQPIEGAKVTMHSKIQEATTNKEGIVEFKNVEAGDHKVLIAYQNFQGEQSVNLTGDVKEFDLNITVQEKSVLLSPLAIGIIGGMGIVILILVIYVIKTRKYLGK
jgi:hypothetical protein